VLLPEAASEHGSTYDTLFFISFALIMFVQIITQALLHYFSYRYRGLKNTNGQMSLGVSGGFDDSNDHKISYKYRIFF